MVSEHASPLAVAGGVDAGGQNVHVAALATALSELGHDMRVFTRRDSPDLPAVVRAPGGYLVEHVPAGPARPIPKDDLVGHMHRFSRYLIRRLRVEPADLIHSHFWMSGMAAGTASTQLDIPWAHTFHALGVVKRRHQGPADTSPVDRIRHEHQICRTADRIIATCLDEVLELRAMGLPTNRASIIPCGVDLRRFTPTGAVATRGPRHRLLLISRLVPRKGIADAIHALAQLPDVELCVAGGPPADLLSTDPEARRLRRIARDLEVGHQLQLLGQVPHSGMPELIRSADVVLAVPWYEPFGIVPLEAMACGKPVIATAVAGLTDSVVPGVTGLLVPPRDPRALADAVRTLLADDRLRRAYGRAGARRAQQRFGWPRIAEQTVAAYQQTIDTHAPADSGAAEQATTGSLA